MTQRRRFVPGEERKTTFSYAPLRIFEASKVEEVMAKSEEPGQQLEFDCKDVKSPDIRI
ncbi:hypothetical protein KP004_18775 [Geomonas oryzisoli]|uniref:Uncharacterized protein n=1 Tax=Geomonas oryzisoli TaxID=2847992 RepID=A0ABX8J7Z2_9BACT|nr:hypothetical protein [Geomonas oryzisoli]QWV93187.1 hypothetical protein KP004_18775 [Geomonas oryzisoli]